MTIDRSHALLLVSLLAFGRPGVVEGQGRGPELDLPGRAITEAPLLLLDQPSGEPDDHGGPVAARSGEWPHAAPVPWLSDHPRAAPAFSAVLPGSGQLALGQRRGWAYLLADAVGWAVFLDRRGAGLTYRDRYRDFAWERARLADGPRVDGDFAYYERMSQWARSGRYDVDQGRDGVQPEPDAATYNGRIWQRALGLFGASEGVEDARFRSAVAYYEARAYDERFLWDWSDHPGDRAQMSSLIEASDERLRIATLALGAVLANRLVSMTDAFVATRGLQLGLGPGTISDWMFWIRWEGAP